MDKPFRMSRQAQQVLLHMLSAPRDEFSGVDLSEETKILSGTLYPLLYRMEGAGLVRARWEEQRPEDLGRPRRRFYTLTAAGVTAAKKEVKHVTGLLGALAWKS